MSEFWFNGEVRDEPCFLEVFSQENLPLITGETLREKITTIADYFKSLDKPDRLDPEDFELHHYFADGVYGREIHIKKGRYLVGYIHRNDCISTVNRGDLSILTEDGVIRVKAGETFPSRAGVQRVGFAHEYTVFTTFHPNPTNETDPDKLLDLLVVPDFDSLPAAKTVLEDKQMGTIMNTTEVPLCQ